VPIEVYSAHWIEHPDFSDAIQKFLNQEEVHIKEYINLASNKLPYK
jgi:predicted N-acyltransferase